MNATTVSSVELLAAVPSLPRHEAERLLMTVTGRSRGEIVVGVEVDAPARERFLALARRRLDGEPLQYLEGVIPFGPAEIAVDPRVLIPRPETEELFELAAGLAADPRLVVDLGTGSGALAVALAMTFPGAEVHAVDVSPDAAAVAAANAARNSVAVAVHVGDLFSPLPAVLTGRVDLLVANPPYVAVDELASLPAEVREHEPLVALVGGRRGTEIIERIGAGAARWLAPGGIAVCEIGETQAVAARAAFAELGGTVRRDLAGRPRFVVGRR